MADFIVSKSLTKNYLTKDVIKFEIITTALKILKKLGFVAEKLIFYAFL